MRGVRSWRERARLSPTLTVDTHHKRAHDEEAFKEGLTDGRGAGDVFRTTATTMMASESACISGDNACVVARTYIAVSEKEHADRIGKWPCVKPGATPPSFHGDDGLVMGMNIIP